MDGAVGRSLPLTRRATLSAAGAGLAAGALLPGARRARAAELGGPTAVVFEANNQGVPWNATTLGLYQDFLDATFNAANPAIRATVFPGGSGDAQAQILAAMSGSGLADIYEGCCNDIATLQSAGWLAPLGSYLRQNNLDTALWSPGHIEALTFGSDLYGLPSYDGPAVIAYRQDLLDQLGLPYPDASWTAQSAAELWQSCTASRGRALLRQGIDVIYDEAATTWQFWLKGWGAQIMNGAHDACTADVPAAADALSYLAGLHAGGALRGGSGPSDLASGVVVFSMCGGWQVFNLATELGSRFKWDLLPVPNWPAGRATFGNADFYGLARASANPEAAWEVLRWLTAEPDWQRFQMKATMVEPCLLALWDEWQSIVVAVAPPLRGKALSWFQDAALGYAYPTLHFAYGPLEANAVADNWLDQIWNGQVSAPVGLAQIQTQINAIEAAARAEAGPGRAAAAAFPTAGPAMAAVAAGI